MDSVLGLLDTYGVGLLFAVMLLKEIGAPIPVPGDLLMIVAVALGRALPGLRIGAVAACGLAGVPLGTFTLGLFAGTVLFVGFHTMLGYIAGPGVTALFDGLNVPIWVLLLALVLVGLLGWVLIRARRRRTGAKSDDTAPVFDWADACCPACLAAGALERRLVSAQSPTAA